MEHVFRWKAARWLGKYSYGIYVLHLILFIYLEEPLKAWLAPFLPGKGLRVVLAGLISLGLSLLAAFASYRFFEEPFLRLKRFFSYGHTSAATQSPKRPAQAL